jgi:hypothetical protein
MRSSIFSSYRFLFICFSVACVSTIARGPIKYLCNFLETTSFSLREDEVCDREENSQQAAEDNIVLVANVLHADGVTEGRNYQGRIYCEKLTGKSFRSACLSVLFDITFVYCKGLPNVVGEYFC